MKRVLFALLMMVIPALTLAAVVLSPDATPEVKTSDAPEVTDPELKEALPVMRQGTDEPLGGFKERGLKGRSAWVLGWDQVESNGSPKIGFRYWVSNTVAWQAALGGNYREMDSNTFQSSLCEELGLRFKVADLGQVGHSFIDLVGGGRQNDRHDESQSNQGSYIQFDSRHITITTYGVNLRGGAELFWPGSRRASLELSGGLGASWTTTQYRSKYLSSDGLSGSNSLDESTRHSYELGSRYLNLLGAFNLYF